MASFGNAVRAVSRRTIVLTLFLVLLTAGSITAWITHRSHEAGERADRAAVAAAEKAVPQILGYSAATIDADLAAARSLVTGSFKGELTELYSTSVLPAVKADGVNTRAEVGEAGIVDRVTNEKIKVLLFVNQTTTSKTITTPKVDGSRVEVVMVKVDDAWLVADLTPL